MADLNLTKYMDSLKDCIQYEKAYCQIKCPFNLDVIDFMDKLKQGNYNSAFKIYRNAVGFPRIVGEICSEPCKLVCPMKDHGGAMEMSLLEKSTIQHATRTAPTSYNLPVRPGKVAIIGSGLAGLGALLRMATKKYETHIFEASDGIGGDLNGRNGVIDSELFYKDIEEQLHHEKYEVHLNTKITSRKQINDMGFGVVFVATGAGGEDFGLLDAVNEAGEKFALLDGETGWFAGGALIGDTDVFALAGGLYMGLVLEAFIKSGNLNYPMDQSSTNVIVDSNLMVDKEPVLPSDSMEYLTEEEVLEEAGRCIQCKCNFCKTYEDLTTYYDKYPSRIKDEVFATTLEGTSEVKATPAKRLMSTANLTGIVKSVCPKDIDLDNLILAGRQRMHRLEKAPWVFHDFWLRDMDFSNGENGAIIKTAPEKSNYAFFPGCQLGATLPEIVDKTYEHLLSNYPNMALMLRCCGAPAEWSGNDDKHESELGTFKKQWMELGEPTLIMACPTCIRQITNHLSEIPIVSLYEYLDECSRELGSALNCEAKLCDDSKSDIINEFTVFDPCSTRETPGIREAVRNLATSLNLNLSELPKQSQNQRCCSFGGQPAIANPEYVEYVTNERITESDLPYITYCINCRDTFLKSEKESIHILELLFGDTEKNKRQSVPTASQRQDNRVFLKKMMLKKYWSENMEDARTKYDFTLVFPDDVKEEMDAQRILEDEVYNVMEYILRTNRKVVDPETDVHSGYRKIGYMTYWVSYKPGNADVYEVVDVYSHRMEIELEAVWNGVKQENDM